MTNTIQHRGPDDAGEWIDVDSGIALGFRRLAILDLSPTGRQPMISADSRFVMVFNGEIYNHQELRAELSKLGHSFRGTSDSEVMLACFLQWGVRAAVRRFNGMFAIGLWDRQEYTLYLIRDRLGIKPLYYGWSGKAFLFGSELKTLCAHPSFRGEIDRDALSLFFRHNFIPAPHTIYRNVYKLFPGMIAVLKTGEEPAAIAMEPYWSVKETVLDGISHPFTGSEKDALHTLDSLLKESVRQRMIADVPLGAFLSGGVDSSILVAIMQSQSSIPVRTFTIGFGEKGFNEAERARDVAAYLGTQHVERYVTPGEALDLIPRLPQLYDEPFADSSQIPTFLISQITRQHVTVSISGDGGDELFGGYGRYLRAWKSWNWIQRLPSGIRRASNFLSASMGSNLSKVLINLLPASAFPVSLGNKFYYLSEILKCSSSSELYLRLMSHWPTPDDLVINGHEPQTILQRTDGLPQSLEFIHQMMCLDLQMYLPDDLLVKLDRASMGTSLEARVPFLDDHRIVEFAWRLPLAMKVRQGCGKWILRQLLYAYVPREMVDRPKMGFSVPIATWLRGPLRGWAESLLDEWRLRQEGYLNPAPIRKKWNEHLAGRYNWQYYLWDVLMFQAWKQEHP